MKKYRMTINSDHLVFETIRVPQELALTQVPVVHDIQVHGYDRVDWYREYKTQNYRYQNAVEDIRY